MNHINIDEIKKRPFTRDKSGFTFIWRGRFFRAINKDYSEHIKSLFTNGLINELVDKKLFPKSEITDYILEDSSFVVEHEYYPIVTSPSEWSFLMLQDAAITVLKVNQIANKYGYRTIDAHGYNIVFNVTNPVFVDLGSFVPLGNESIKRHHGWPAYQEYMQFFFYPLKMWSNGNSVLAKKAISGEYMPSYEYYLYKYPIFRWLPLSFIKKPIFLFYSYKMVNVLSNQFIGEYLKMSEFRKKIAKLIFWLKGKNFLPFSSVNLTRLQKRTENISRRKNTSQWGEYYTTDKISDRFKRIRDIIIEYKISDVLELAGNNGFVSKLLLNQTQVKKVICSDYDENAIDNLYSTAKKDNLNITPVLLNFMKSPTNLQLKSEAVLALAVTHHLILTQDYPIEYIFERIEIFSKKYVFIEFMPLGLYSQGVAPAVPDWYTTSWFRTKFTAQFELLIEEQLSVNRIIFVGKIKN